MMKKGMRHFASEFAFGTGRDKSRMAVITFADKATIGYKWTDLQTDNAIDTFFRRLPYAEGETFIVSYVHKPSVNASHNPVAYESTVSGVARGGGGAPAVGAPPQTPLALRPRSR